MPDADNAQDGMNSSNPFEGAGSFRRQADGNKYGNDPINENKGYQNKLNQARMMDKVRGNLDKLKKTDYNKDGEVGSAIDNSSRLEKISANIVSGNKSNALAEAVKLGFELRKQIKEAKDIPFVFLLILASAGDVIDLLNLVFDAFAIGIIIPPLGIISRAAIFVIMFISLWGQGNFVKKIILRILMVTIIESIPFFPFSLIAILPIETLAILWIWSSTHRKVKKTEDRLKSVDRKIKNHTPSVAEDLKKIIADLMK
ncbi:MAG: hypothetical protein WC120_00050 [Parcubacteria group bacterium]